MNNQHDLFDQLDDSLVEDTPTPDPIAPSLLGSLAPIMQPESLARIEANYQEWLSRQVWAREKEEAE
jgi:hypothetical protein